MSGRRASQSEMINPWLPEHDPRGMRPFPSMTSEPPAKRSHVIHDVNPWPTLVGNGGSSGRGLRRFLKDDEPEVAQSLLGEVETYNALFPPPSTTSSRTPSPVEESSERGSSVSPHSSPSSKRLPMFDQQGIHPHPHGHQCEEDYLLEYDEAGNSRYKTEVCRNFKERSRCVYGDQCQFAHGRRELRDVARNAKYKTKLCQKYWLSGYCAYGPRCNFLHNELTGAESACSLESHREPHLSIGHAGAQNRAYRQPHSRM